MECDIFFRTTRECGVGPDRGLSGVRRHRGEGKPHSGGEAARAILAVGQPVAGRPRRRSWRRARCSHHASLGRHGSGSCLLSSRRRGAVRDRGGEVRNREPQLRSRRPIAHRQLNGLRAALRGARGLSIPQVASQGRCRARSVRQLCRSDRERLRSRHSAG